VKKKVKGFLIKETKDLKQKEEEKWLIQE